MPTNNNQSTFAGAGYLFGCGLGAEITAAATITLTSGVHVVSGSTTITTINGGQTNPNVAYLIKKAGATWVLGTGGNVSAPVPAAIPADCAVTLVWDGTTNWRVAGIGAVPDGVLKSLNAIRFADQFSGATVVDKINAAIDDFAGTEGVVVIPSSLADSAYPTLAEHNNGVTIIDLRGRANGGVRVMRKNLGASGRALVGVARNKGTNNLAEGVVGDAQEAGDGANVHGTSGYVASASSAGVFGYNYGSGGNGGAGIQGDGTLASDGATLGGGVGILGTSGDSGQTANPAIAVKGVSGGGVLSFAGSFESADLDGVKTRWTASATGGRSFEPFSSANTHAVGGGYFGVYSRSSNKYAFKIHWDSPSGALTCGPTGVQIGASGTEIAKHLSVTAAWDPGNLTAGTQTTTTVTVTGAALGDTVVAAFDKDLQAMQLTAYVSATDTVTVVLRNGTAGAIDLASGTLRIDHWKH